MLSIRIRRLVVSFALGSLILVPGSSKAADGTWLDVASSGLERSTPAVGALGKNIYIFGGVHDDFRTGVAMFYNDLHRFNTASMAMEELHPDGIAPLPRAFAAGVADPARKRLYVFGGATYQANFVGFYAHDDLQAYDVEQNRWRRLGRLTGGPQGRSRPSMWLDGHKLYVFGGVTSALETLNDLWRFDLDSETWTRLIANGAAGSPPTRHEALNGQYPVSGKLTIYSGEHIDPSDPAFFSIPGDTWSYDIATNTWTDRTPAAPNNVDPARNYGSAAVIGNAMYMHGGDIPGGSQGCGAPFPQNPSDELWRLDLTTYAWSKLSPGGDPLVPLKRSVATVVDGTMYVLAGFDFDCEELTSPGQIWNSRIYSYTP
jgi:N-acetylneuraminic acid mutarotase